MSVDERTTELLEVLERIAQTLERIETTSAEISQKLDTANEQLLDLTRSQRA